MWKKIFPAQPPNHAHSNTYWLKTLLLPGVRKKIFQYQPLDQAHSNTHWRKTVLLPEVWKTIFHCQWHDHAHTNTHWGKTTLLPGVWKSVHWSKLPDQAHANTQWRKTVLLPEVWKKIFPVQPPENAYADTRWRKVILLSGVPKKIFHYQPLDHAYANTHWRKPFCSQKDGNKFSIVGHLKAHMRTHTGEKHIVARSVEKGSPSPATWPGTFEHILEINFIVARSLVKDFLLQETWPVTCELSLDCDKPGCTLFSVFEVYPTENSGTVWKQVKKQKLALTEISPKLNTTSLAHKYAVKLLLARKHGSIQRATCDAYGGVKGTQLQESNVNITSIIFSPGQLKSSNGYKLARLKETLSQWMSFTRLFTIHSTTLFPNNNG